MSEALKLSCDCLLPGVKRVPNLLASRVVSFTQRTHVPLNQVFHEFFNLVLAQIGAQKCDAFTLCFALQGPMDGKEKRDGEEYFHGF